MSEPAPSDAVALRLAVTEGSRTRRVDVVLGPGGAARVEQGVRTALDPARLWPEVRSLLPDVGGLRADPRGRPAPEPREAPAGFAERCRAVVVVATAVGERPVVVRTWLATDDEVWSADPRPDGTTDLRPAAPGALADLLLWDTTGALEALLAPAVDGDAS